MPINNEKLRNLIKSRGVSGAYICRELGKHRHFIIDIYNGVTTPTDAQIATIAQILHTTPDYLTDKTNDPNQEPSSLQPPKTPIKKETAVVSDLDNEIISLFNSLSDEQKFRFLDLLRSLIPPKS